MGKMASQFEIDVMREIEEDTNRYWCALINQYCKGPHGKYILELFPGINEGCENQMVQVLKERVNLIQLALKEKYILFEVEK